MLISHHSASLTYTGVMSSRGVDVMARNPIQFQPGLSLPAFLEQYGTEAQCQAALFQHRWPKGFVCPECGNSTGCRLSRAQHLPPLPPSNLADGRPHLSCDTPAVDHLVPGHLSADPAQEWYLGTTTVPGAWGRLQHGLEA